MACYEDREVAKDGYTVVSKFQGKLFTAKQVNDAMCDVLNQLFFSHRTTLPLMLLVGMVTTTHINMTSAASLSSVLCHLITQ